MKNRNSNIFALLTFLAILGFVCPAAAQVASVRKGWNYGHSHGMKNCTFWVRGSPGQTVNSEEVESPPPENSIRVTGEKGRSLHLFLSCRREQSFDRSTGELIWVGEEGTYSGPGVPRVVGTDSPGQTASGHNSSFAKGREWTVFVGDSPTKYTLYWRHPIFGSDQITVQVVPVTPPVSVHQLDMVVEPMQAQNQTNWNMAIQAYDLADSQGGWENRSVSLGGTYQLGMDSLSRDADARQGGALDLGVHLGEDENVKFLTGGTLTFSHDQKKIVAVPNQPTNGFNSWTEWSRIYMGPKAGIDYMPVKLFSLQAYGSLGVMLSLDGTIPESQLPDKTLYTGESDTVAAFAYRAALQPTFVIGEHFTVFASTSLEGNITKLPTERGPEKVCDGATNDCFVRRDGHFLDWSLGGGIGAMW